MKIILFYFFTQVQATNFRTDIRDGQNEDMIIGNAHLGGDAAGNDRIAAYLPPNIMLYASHQALATSLLTVSLVVFTLSSWYGLSISMIFGAIQV